MREEHDDLLVLEEGSDTEMPMTCICTTSVTKIK